MGKPTSLEDLTKRVEKLEKLVFGQSKTDGPRKGANFSGATGGLRFLIDKAFFNQRRLFREVEAELKKHGYHYSKQAIQTPLNRLSAVGGPLVALKEKGNKVYVKRK